MEQRILVAFDESENAMRAVDFICAHFTPQHKVTLFSVIPDSVALCSIGGPGLTPYFITQKDTFCEMEERKKALISEAMEAARGRLLKAGFEEGKIALRTVVQERGIARDILEEASTGYDMVVIGRRGLSGIQQFLMGSVSQKVLGGVGHIPVIIVN